MEALTSTNLWFAPSPSGRGGNASKTSGESATDFSHPLNLIQWLFTQGADNYARVIDPTHAPLAADFVAWVEPSATDCVLDVGSGTGQIARLIAPQVRHVIALDVAAAALRAGAGAYDRVVGDCHVPPFVPDTFDLITASLGLNATDPARSLRALRRLLRAGGRLAIQEWGPLTPLDQVFGEVFGEYMLDDPPAELANLRVALLDYPAPWSDHLQDTDDYREWLAEVGFAVETVTESAPVVVRLSVSEFIAYKLAWPDRQAEIRAMTPAARDDCVRAISARLAEFVTAPGVLVWEPVVFRVKARVV